MNRRTFPYLIALLILGLNSCQAQSSPDGNSSPEAGIPVATRTLPPPRVTQRAVTPPPEPVQASPSAPATQIEVTLGDLREVEIQFWHPWDWESGQALEALVEEFNRTNDHGIQVSARQQGGFGDLSRAFYDGLRSGELPHLIVGFPNQIRSWQADSGLIINLLPYLDDPQWGLSESDRDAFYLTFWEEDLEAGVRLGLPAQRTAQVLFYNRTWAQELGFEQPPETVQAFQDQACTAAGQLRSDEDPDNDGLGGWVVDTSPATALTWIFAFGGEIETDQGYRFAGPEGMDALAFTKELFDQGCAWLSRNRFPNEEFASRKALFIASSSTGVPFQERAFESSGQQDDWTAIPFPGVGGKPVIAVAGPSFAMVESSPPEQLATWLLVDWLLEPENQARWIQSGGHLPTRADALPSLDGYRQAHPQWAAIVDLLAWSRPEPHHASWGSVRWALGDAAEQVFRLGLTLDQIPSLLDELDRTAAELHAR